jgi:hypothetical protein
MDAVADRNIDETVFAADRHRRLRAELRQGEEASALTATEDESKNFAVHGHDGSKWYTLCV